MNRRNWKSDKIFTRLLNNKTQKTFWDNITELWKRPNNEVYDKAFNLAKSTNDKEKIIRINVLAQLGINQRFQQKKTVDLYIKLIENEKSPKIISLILSSIGHNNKILTENQVSKIIKFKKHNYSSVRFSLVFSLLGLENEKAIETLIQLSNDKYQHIRNWATFGLGTQIMKDNQKIREALWERISDIDNETKFEAIIGLANRKDYRVKKIIINELNKENYETLLFDAILKLKDKDFLTLLNENLEKARISNNYNNYGWVLALEETIEKLKKKTNAQQHI